MRFMTLYKPGKDGGPPPTEREMAEMGRLIEEGIKSGFLIETGGLLPSSHGARVRYDGGKLTVIDGPFAEAKELVGGYAIIEAKSKEEAVAWALRCPAQDGDVIEVRQVQEMADFPADVQEAAAGFAELQAKPAQRKGS